MAAYLFGCPSIVQSLIPPPLRSPLPPLVLLVHHTFYCASIPSRFPWPASSRLAPGILETAHSRGTQLYDSLTVCHSILISHESSAPAPGPRHRHRHPEPDERTCLSCDLLARRQAGFNSLPAASPSAYTASVPDTSARSRPPVPYWAATLGLFPRGQDGRRARRPAPAANPRTDIATELDLDHSLPSPPTAPGHLVDCSSSRRSSRSRRKFDIEPATTEVGGQSDCKIYSSM